MWITLSNSLLWLREQQPRLVLRKAVIKRGEKTGGFWRILWQKPWGFTWVSPHDVNYGQEDADLQEEVEESPSEEQRPELEESEKSHGPRLVMRKGRSRNAA